MYELKKKRMTSAVTSSPSISPKPSASITINNPLVQSNEIQPQANSKPHILPPRRPTKKLKSNLSEQTGAAYAPPEQDLKLAQMNPSRSRRRSLRKPKKDVNNANQPTTTATSSSKPRMRKAPPSSSNSPTSSSDSSPSPPRRDTPSMSSFLPHASVSTSTIPSATKSSISSVTSNTTPNLTNNQNKYHTKINNYHNNHRKYVPHQPHTQHQASTKPNLPSSKDTEQKTAPSPIMTLGSATPLSTSPNNPAPIATPAVDQPQSTIRSSVPTSNPSITTHANDDISNQTVSAPTLKGVPITLSTPQQNLKATSPRNAISKPLASSPPKQTPFPKASNLPLWATKPIELTDNLGDHLTQEILQFCAWIRETPEEKLMRKEIHETISQTVKSLWPNARVEAFGSTVSGLSLPVSDIDLGIFGEIPMSQYASPLYTLASEIESKSLTKDLKAISSASVPIIKMVEKKWDTMVDISFNSSAGVRNTKMVTQFMKEYPQVEPLALVIKYLLYQHRMNETFSGGVGSYTLVLMIISIIQHQAKRFASGSSLGDLFLDFLEIYGKLFDFQTMGIAVSNGGYFFSKEKRGMLDPLAPGALCIIDPEDEVSDLGRKSFAFQNVQQFFAHTYDFLSQQETNNRFHNQFLLSSILVIDGMIVSRRKNLKNFYGKGLSNQPQQERKKQQYHQHSHPHQPQQSNPICV